MIEQHVAMDGDHAEEHRMACRTEDGVHVELTYSHLSPLDAMSNVKSPKAGAVVLFAGSSVTGTWVVSKVDILRAGTTRDSFESKPVKQLEYQAYVPLALATLAKVAREVKTKHSLTAVYMIHRLGVVPIGEESILIAVSAPHRHAAWNGGEEALEECKERVEVWKLEEFEGDEEGVWRANRDGKMGSRTSKRLGKNEVDGAR